MRDPPSACHSPGEDEKKEAFSDILGCHSGLHNGPFTLYSSFVFAATLRTRIFAKFA